MNYDPQKLPPDETAEAAVGHYFRGTRRATRISVSDQCYRIGENHETKDMFPYLPPATRNLIIANVAVFLGGVVIGDALTLDFALWPIGTLSSHGEIPGFQPWQIVTYSFLHASTTHLFVNMFALFMFGGELERLFGHKRFLSLYFTGVIAAALAQLIVASFAGGEPYPTVGASGGIFGLLLAYGMYFPNRRILLLIPPIPLPAWIFVTLYAALELFLGVTGTQEGVAHFAHLGGMLGAWFLILYWRGLPPFRMR